MISADQTDFCASHDVIKTSTAELWGIVSFCLLSKTVFLWNNAVEIYMSLPNHVFILDISVLEKYEGKPDHSQEIMIDLSPVAKV